MKKNFILLAFLAGIIVLSSCSSKSSFEGDVRKMANYQCQVKQLKAKGDTDEKAKAELEKVEKAMKEFDDKMEAKYKDKKPNEAQQEKAKKIMEEVEAKCK